jgi:purine-nucleoside phosphorylase
MTPTLGVEAARLAAAVVRARVGEYRPVAALVLGSGLGRLAGEIHRAVIIPYGEIPGFPTTTVAGHAGELIVGTLAGRPVIAFSGRFHHYEGHDIRLTALPARVAHALGAEALILSNAAGGIRPTFKPGALMLITDHINLLFRNPLIGAVEPGDERFPDMSDPYDPVLRALARSVAEDLEIPLEEGVYASLPGPSYETRAEVRMLSMLGADAVGMSTVPEVLVARAIGLRVLAISCITNLASGLSDTPITHADVIASSTDAALQFEALAAGIVAAL